MISFIITIFTWTDMLSTYFPSRSSYVWRATLEEEGEANNLDPSETRYIYYFYKLFFLNITLQVIIEASRHTLCWKLYKGMVKDT